MEACVYILKNKKGNFYVGSTDNLTRRLKQHLTGHTRTTHNRRMYNLVMVQKYDSLTTARKVERRIKNMKRSDYIEKMVTDGYIKIRP